MSSRAVCSLAGLWLAAAVGFCAAAEQAPTYLGDVVPFIYRHGCNAAGCHASATGKGGLKLSLFGAYPRDDYDALVRQAAGRRVDPVRPAESLLLRKLSGQVPHAGGKFAPAGSDEYRHLLAWLQAGAPYGTEGGRRLTAVVVAPAEKTLPAGGAFRLKVTAKFSDGSSRDVTAETRFSTSDPAVAKVDAAGAVRAVREGEAVVVATFMRRSGVVRVLVPTKFPGPFPPPEAANRIDELVYAKLKRLNLPPSGPASDAEFLRRVYLDTIGLLPTPDEARAFLDEKAPDKRARLIDRLLEREEFADFWALKWGDLLRIKSEFPSNLWPNGVQAYHRWVRHSLATNKPYDRFVRELLLATGSNFRSPPSNYYRALRKRDAQGYAEATALVFMGVRLECARCHGHPYEPWTLEDNLRMAAFFPQVRIKTTREWKEEIVYLSARQTLRHPRTRQVVRPAPLGGEPVEIPPGRDAREKFADWLLAADNPWFARNIVNRVWFWLLGVGIVREVDDLRPTNPPSNPQLLDFLAADFVAHKYDLKHLYRLILNSKTYQRSGVPNRWNAFDTAHFARYPVKRLGAEQLLDAIGRVTETYESYMSRVPEPYTRLPAGTRAVQVFDGSIGSSFLELFGRPPRDTAYEADRCSRPSMRQALYMVNSSQLEGKVARSPRIARMLKEKKTDEQIIEEIFLAALSRRPTAAEKKAIAEYFKTDKNRTRVVRDLMWAVLNTKEFLFNH